MMMMTFFFVVKELKNKPQTTINYQCPQTATYVRMAGAGVYVVWMRLIIYNSGEKWIFTRNVVVVVLWAQV